jgi:hypothetical protein
MSLSQVFPMLLFGPVSIERPNRRTRACLRSCRSRDTETRSDAGYGIPLPILRQMHSNTDPRNRSGGRHEPECETAISSK